MFTAFVGAADGVWRVVSMAPVVGDPLPPAMGLSVEPRDSVPASDGGWPLMGVASNVRYVERAEKQSLQARQAGLGRPEATRAALIPIRKTAAWWDMTQEERRQVFEAQSRHIADSLKYLPQIARKLYHSRDIGQEFDFLTWFEYAPEHADDFEALVAHLRGTPEWAYVDRETDIRLARA